jgi:hypothetical protein
MSLTSYRAAPSRATNMDRANTLIQKEKKADAVELRLRSAFLNYEWVFSVLFYQSACCNAWRRPTLPTLKR